jgi:hypothetical protein
LEWRGAKRGERSSFYVSPGKRDIWKWLYCSLFLFGRGNGRPFLIVVFPLTVSSIFELFFHFSSFLFDQIWETARITKGLAPSLCHRAKQSEKWERRLLEITWSRLNCGYIIQLRDKNEKHNQPSQMFMFPIREMGVFHLPDRFEHFFFKVKRLMH